MFKKRFRMFLSGLNQPYNPNMQIWRINFPFGSVSCWVPYYIYYSYHYNHYFFGGVGLTVDDQSQLDCHPSFFNAPLVHLCSFLQLWHVLPVGPAATSDTVDPHQGT